MYYHFRKSLFLILEMIFRNVVKAFYTSGMIYDVLDLFGELTEDVIQNRKYAKWKAAYIHNCLKNGETPIPGPLNDDENFDEPSSSSSNVDPPKPQYPIPPSPTDNSGAESSGIINLFYVLEKKLSDRLNF